MKKIYSLFLILLLAVGCYEDKGNYDYKDIKELTMGNFEAVGNVLRATVGEDIIVKTTITPDISQELDRYIFKWSIDGETRPEWNKKDFIWTADRPTPISKSSEYLTLEITDTRFGTRYSNRKDIRITPEFITTNGFLILAEDESGNSKLHYLKYITREDRPDPVDPSVSIKFPIDIKKYINVYEKQNDGKSLGKGPIGIQQHFIQEPTGAQYCIFQKSGAVDIEYTALRKEGLFSDTFEGGVYPNGTDYLNGGSIMHWLDVMSDQKGRLFSRFKFDENLYNTGTFINKPTELNGEVLEECTVFRTNYGIHLGSFIFDKKKGRLLFMFDGGVDYFSKHKFAGKVIVVPDPEGGVTNGSLSYNDFKGCEILAINVENEGDNNLSVVYRDKSGKIALQITKLFVPYGKPDLLNKGTKNYLIANAPADISRICIPQIYNQNYIFIISGKKIYFTDINSENYTAELYFTADSDITAISNGGAKPHNLIFGTVDGFFYNIDIYGARNKISSKVDDKLKLLYKTDGFGRIVDLIHCLQESHP